MIGLSRFRSAMVREPMVKVAYISKQSAFEFDKTNVLNVDPGYIGTGTLVETAPGEIQLKVVGIGLEDVLTGSDNKRNRAYRWSMNEPVSDKFVNEDDSPMSSDERMALILEEWYTSGKYPPVDVVVIDSVLEQVFVHDESVEPPHGIYREFSFEAIVNYPLVDEDENIIKNEYVVLITDL